MQAKKHLRYWLATVVLFSLLLAPTVFATNQSTSVQFDQRMDLALQIWYSQNPDSNLPDFVHTISSDGTGSITGTVMQGNNAIEGADVFCWAVLSEKVISQSAKTDAEGVYKLESLEAGDYFVIASAASDQWSA